MKIIVENSTWNNLGDGFYQFALYELVKKIFPDASVYYGEGPVERAFKPKERHYKNALKVNEHQMADINIISGPMLDRLVNSDYKQMIENILKRGDKYALLSCSCAGLEGEKLKKVKEFVQKNPPIAFSSRDPDTFHKFKDVVSNAYNGICTAFLVDKVLNIDTFEFERKYFVSSFYRSPEPNFSSTDFIKSITDVSLKNDEQYLKFLDWRINRHLEIYKNKPAQLENLAIIRTVQQVSTKSNNFNFKYPNSFITWNPLNMLSIFKGAEFTISDRVHACATTLAFGKPARITYKNARNGIYTRLGLDFEKNDGVMYPDGLNEKIEQEMQSLVDYIRDSFSSVGK